MASRVTVQVNVRDNSRAGIAQVRRQIRRMNDDIRRAGGTANFRVQLDEPSARAARAELDRLRRDLSSRDEIRIRTNVQPPDRNRFRRTVLNTLTSPARTTGSIVGGILSDGIGQGIIAGFRTAGPIGMGVFAGVIAGSLSIIGAALSGLLITALGAAFVGIGAVSAAQSETVKTQWQETLGTLKEQFTSVGEPLIPVLDRALERLESMAEVAGPTLRKALEETAPATEKFINSIMDGFASFGKAAFQPIMDAWNVFAPVFGEEWNEFMDELGNSFKEMAKLVEEHPTEIAAALDVVFEVLDLLVDTVTFFAEAWVFAMNTAFKSAELFGQAIAFLGEIALDSLSTILSAADFAFGWIPGIGDDLGTAVEAFEVFKVQAQEKLNTIARAGEEMGGALDRANKTRKLEADILTWQEKLRIARADLKKTSDQKARAKLQADISDLQSKIATAKDQLSSLNGRTASVNINTYYNTYGAPPPLASAGRLATGGVRGLSRAATGGVRSNMTLVGEQGPELIDLAPGSRVRSASNTKIAMGGGSGGGPTVLEIRSSGRPEDDFLVEWLRRAVYVRGGNVQLVFGS